MSHRTRVDQVYSGMPRIPIMSAQVGERHVIPEWSLGDRLRKIRRTAGLSQVEFADQLGENQKTYAAWELDTSAPRNVVALAKRIEIAGRPCRSRSLPSSPPDEG